MKKGNLKSKNKYKYVNDKNINELIEFVAKTKNFVISKNQFGQYSAIIINKHGAIHDTFITEIVMPNDYAISVVKSTPKSSKTYFCPTNCPILVSQLYTADMRKYLISQPNAERYFQGLQNYINEQAQSEIDTYRSYLPIQKVGIEKPEELN